jgi:ribosome maturation factor RimP
VTSPGLERQLRTPVHFRREIGKAVTVRLADASADPRRIDGQLVSADDRTATLLLDSGEEHVVELSAIDKARTVFAFGPKPKPGAAKPKSAKPGAAKPNGAKREMASSKTATTQAAQTATPSISNKETQSS